METVPISRADRESYRSFDCGNEELNTYLLRYASQNDRKGLGKTFIAMEEGRTIGYYTLASAQLRSDDLPGIMLKNLPRYPIPCIRIARLAVDKLFQKRGYGSTLLKDALLKIDNISELTGIFLVIVDVKEGAEGFYEHYNFIPFNEKKQLYLLPLKTLKKTLE